MCVGVYVRPGLPGGEEVVAIRGLSSAEGVSVSVGAVFLSLSILQ